MLNYNYFNCLLPGKPQNVGFVSLGLRRYENRRFFSSLYMLEMTPEHISGKEAIELVNRSADF